MDNLPESSNCSVILRIVYCTIHTAAPALYFMVDIPEPGASQARRINPENRVTIEQHSDTPGRQYRSSPFIAL